MNRIRLLSEQVANQIAAGEVVERPASVVKELVENALDAKATRISVEIQAGGRSLIRVTDDGQGMSRDDALLCLERHATSKIQTAQDLTGIQTMGFRGEAVPSIASVSRMTLTTRERGEGGESGTQIVIHGGRILEVKEAGCAPGACLEVRNLFFNLPARRKFLRSEETERAHIQHYLSLAALAFPEVAFTFLDDQRVIWQLPQVLPAAASVPELPALRERLRSLYGAELKLLSVDSRQATPSWTGDDENSGEAGSIRVWGFIGVPGVSRSTRDEQHLFVNRRPVENRGLNFALLEGYHTALMKGRYPICCLFLEMDPGTVDVNIHPAKREVRFHQEQSVRRFVAQAVRDALLRFHTEPAAESASRATGTQARPGTTTDLAKGPAVTPSPGIAPPARAPTSTPMLPGPLAPIGTGEAFLGRDPKSPGLRHFETEEERSEADRPGPSEVDLPQFPGIPARSGSAGLPVGTTGTPPLRGGVESAAGSGSGMGAMKAAPGLGEPVPLLQVPLRLLGVVGCLYVILESDRGLVLLDQHAAHERILFEQMLRRMEQGNAPSQRLLLPETIELSPRDSQFLREQLDCLTRMGVGLSEFGERTFLLDALPPFVRAADARRFVLELVDSLKAAAETVNVGRLAEHTVAKTVCRHAVKANDPLAPEELENLVNDLRLCSMPYTCPHGRPTLIEMNFRELEKKFGRAQ